MSENETIESNETERSTSEIKEQDIFFSNLELVLSHEADILASDDYFFCKPTFASFALGGTVQIRLGTLLVGWRTGDLIDKCPIITETRAPCGGKSFVFRFGGLFSGTGWRGYCTTCKKSQFTWEGSKTMDRIGFVSTFNDLLKSAVEETEQYETTVYSLKDDAIVPAVKERKVTRSLVPEVTTFDLIEELKSGKSRKPTAKDKTLLPEFITIGGGDSKKPEREVRILPD